MYSPGTHQLGSRNISPTTLWSVLGHGQRKTKYAVCHLLRIDLHVYSDVQGDWLKMTPRTMDPTLDSRDISDMSIYINHAHSHYEVVQSVSPCPRCCPNNAEAANHMSLSHYLIPYLITVHRPVIQWPFQCQHSPSWHSRSPLASSSDHSRSPSMNSRTPSIAFKHS